LGCNLGVAGDGYAHERENVMLRNLGISLLLLGLLGTAIDGFRLRDRVRTSPGIDATTTAPDVHITEGATMPPR
jgi:hypothetical protein